jgi:hypothetical protein
VQERHAQHTLEPGSNIIPNDDLYVISAIEKLRMTTVVVGPVLRGSIHIHPVVALIVVVTIAASHVFGSEQNFVAAGRGHAGQIRAIR